MPEFVWRFHESGKRWNCFARSQDGNETLVGGLRFNPETSYYDDESGHAISRRWDEAQETIEKRVRPSAAPTQKARKR